MQIQLDFRSGQPIYLQIVDQVRHMIVTDELKGGDRLPTVRQLATDLRVNFNTVARAYRILDEAGLVSTQHGRGTYVWEGPPPEATSHVRQQGLQELTRDYLRLARRLGYLPYEVIMAFEAQIEIWQETI